ncbi:hypothetical protein FRC06_009622, partial [Ceratobasidium sp. 370]
VLPREYVDDTAHGPNSSGLDLPGNRQSMGTETLEGAHSTGRVSTGMHGVDLKHRTNTLLSPVHEVLTPVTSVAGTPRPTFGAFGA